MKRALLVMLILSTCGCATIMNGRNQEVGIGSTPAGADCKIGEVTVKTPSVATLRRNGAHTIMCDLPGYMSSGASLSSGMSGWVWGDLVFGGVIGLVIDLSTGGAYKLTPENIQLTLQPIPKAEAAKPEEKK